MNEVNGLPSPIGRLSSTMKESFEKAEDEATSFAIKITKLFGNSIEKFKSRTCVTPMVGEQPLNNIYTIKYVPNPL